MNTFSLCSDVKSLQQPDKGIIYGLIYFDFFKHQFPEKDWNDSIAVILTWWVLSIKDIAFGDCNEKELWFMDGPLYINIRRVNGDICTLECIDERSSKIPEFSVQSTFTHVIKEIINCAEKVNIFCKEKKWITDDTKKLMQVTNDFINAYNILNK